MPLLLTTSICSHNKSRLLLLLNEIQIVCSYHYLLLFLPLLSSLPIVVLWCYCQRLTFRFRNFSVSKLLPNLWGFQFRFQKIWYRKKSLGIGFGKFGIGKKVSVSVSVKILVSSFSGFQIWKSDEPNPVYSPGMFLGHGFHSSYLFLHQGSEKPLFFPSCLYWIPGISFYVPISLRTIEYDWFNIFPLLYYWQ